MKEKLSLEGTTRFGSIIPKHVTIEDLTTVIEIDTYIRGQENHLYLL